MFEHFVSQATQFRRVNIPSPIALRLIAPHHQIHLKLTVFTQSKKALFVDLLNGYISNVQTILRI